jgi:hypothetical protein
MHADSALHTRHQRVCCMSEPQAALVSQNHVELQSVSGQAHQKVPRKIRYLPFGLPSWTMS